MFMPNLKNRIYLLKLELASLENQLNLQNEQLPESIDQTLLLHGFAKNPDFSDYMLHYTKPLNEEYTFWVCPDQDGCNWGIAYNDLQENFVEFTFDSFEECMESYLSNKDFYHMKTIQGTYTTTTLIDVRNFDSSVSSFFDNLNDGDVQWCIVE